jgi:hypothetical protein
MDVPIAMLIGVQLLRALSVAGKNIPMPKLDGRRVLQRPQADPLIVPEHKVIPMSAGWLLDKAWRSPVSRLPLEKA